MSRRRTRWRCCWSGPSGKGTLLGGCGSLWHVGPGGTEPKPQFFVEKTRASSSPATLAVEHAVSSAKTSLRLTSSASSRTKAFASRKAAFASPVCALNNSTVCEAGQAYTDNHTKAYQDAKPGFDTKLYQNQMVWSPR